MAGMSFCQSQICKPDSERLVSLLEDWGSKDARAQAKKMVDNNTRSQPRCTFFWLQVEFGPRKYNGPALV